MIRKVGGRWVLYSKTKRRGKRKVLGRFKTKEEAEQREREVQYFKRAKR